MTFVTLNSKDCRTTMQFNFPNKISDTQIQNISDKFSQTGMQLIKVIELGHDKYFVFMKLQEMCEEITIYSVKDDFPTHFKVVDDNGNDNPTLPSSTTHIVPHIFPIEWDKTTFRIVFETVTGGIKKIGGTMYLEKVEN